MHIGTCSLIKTVKVIRKC